ncbi:MAG: GAF domain-containing protein [Anaerolineae bacterium]|nr:GAF domain-containing protein [Anaerolineae bacterium]
MVAKRTSVVAPEVVAALPEGFVIPDALVQQAIQTPQRLSESRAGQSEIVLTVAGPRQIVVLGVRQANLELTPIHEQVLHAVAQQAAHLIEQDHHEQLLQQKLSRANDLVEELEFIRRADRELSSRLDPDRVVSYTLDWALRRTMADAGLVIVLERMSKRLILKEYAGIRDLSRVRKLLQAEPFSVEAGVLTALFQSGKAQVADIDNDAAAFPPALNHAKRQLLVPMISHKRAIGVIWLESKQTTRFDQDAVDFVNRVASMAAVALDNAQLFEQAEQLADDMALIYNGGRTIAASLEWEAAVQTIAQGLALAIKGAGAVLFHYDPATQTARQVASYGVSGEVAARAKQQGMVWQVARLPGVMEAIQNNRLVSIEAKHASPAEEAWLAEWQVPLVAVVPLTAQGNTIGLAVLLRNPPATEFIASETFIAESLATHAAAVLRQTLLYSEVRELEKIKSEMIRMASHDLRSPIANINGYLTLVELDLEGQAPPGVAEYLQAIRRSIDRMDELVEGMLALEQVEGRRHHETELFALDDLVRAVLDDQSVAARLKAQLLTRTLDGEAVQVRGVRLQVQQVIVNLVNNAIKYTPHEGQIHVTLRLVQDQGRVHIEVKDNGLGIPENRQARLFERFYRAKQPGTEEISGTGLGLSLVKTIVERHHGQVYFESQEGQGSLFGFWLPVAASAKLSPASLG